MSKLTLKQSTQAGRDEALFDWLSNTQLATVLDGGSAAVVAIAPDGVEHDAHVDLYGLWLDDFGGYVTDARGWTIDLHY